jgi:ATP-dependent DNA ligase
MKMKLNREKLTAVHGCMEGAADAVDAGLSAKATEYKKMVTKMFQQLNPEQMDSRLNGTKFYVTRKYDGEFALICFDSQNSFILNRSGKVRIGLPCVEQAGKALAEVGIRQAIIPAELYLDETSGRTRVFEVLEALANEQAIKNLRLAPFDICELDDEDYKSCSYAETHQKLIEIFGKTEMCQPVRMEVASSKQGIMDIYHRWVDEDNAEGLVVRSELPLIYKIKPRHTVDVAVIGFSEGAGDRKGTIRSLLLAMMTENGNFQIVGRTGNGFCDEMKTTLMENLSPKIIKSSYIETDSNHVAFHLVQPEMVIELMVNDVLFETTSCPIENIVLEYKNNSYSRIGSVEGISFIYPIFVRFREDKKVCPEDVRLSQINSFSAVPQETSVDNETELPKSRLLHREVYCKGTSDKIMVQKFLVWETCKDKNPDYPAFVFHYTNFSSDRKEPLQRNVFISNDREQIMQLTNDAICENIKKGWEKVCEKVLAG